MLSKSPYSVSPMTLSEGSLYLRGPEDPSDHLKDGTPMEQGCTVSPDSRLRNLIWFKDYVRDCIPTSHKDDERVHKALEPISVWLELYHAFGFILSVDEAPRLIKSIENAVNDCLYVMAQGFSWVDYYKWKNAAFFSANMGQPIPNRKFGVEHERPDILLGGKFFVFQKRIFRRGKREEFCVSVLMSKKGMPRPDDAFTDAAKVECERLMTSPKDQVAFLHPTCVDNMKVDVTREKLEKELRRTSRELFEGTDFDLNVLTSPVFPSFSANYNMSRADHGAVGHIVDSLVGGDLSKFEDPLLVSVRGEEVTYRGDETEENYLDRFLGVENEDEGQFVSGAVNVKAFERSYNRLYWNLFRLALEEEPRVKVVALKEALKVRCISKGPPLTYFVLKPIQKYMWRVLRKFPAFRLIGEEVTEDVINDVFGRFSGEDPWFHSGDYRNATDELHSWVSEVILDELITLWENKCGHSLDQLRTLMMRALTRHVYEFDDGSTHPQERGQLMGSIISFVFLCIANFSLCRASLEFGERRRYQVNGRIPLLINGDDCAVGLQDAKSKSLYQWFWTRAGDVMGLSESVGKTYCDRTMVTVNSRFFRLDHRGRWHCIPFINLGLLHCLKRSSQGSGKEGGVYDLRDNFLDLQRNCPVSCWERVKALFKRIHFERLSSFRGSWSLPRVYGGLGLPLCTPTDLDLRIGNVVRKNLESGCMRLFPVNNETYSVDRLIEKHVRELCPLVVPRRVRWCSESASYGEAYLALAWGCLWKYVVNLRMERLNGTFVRPVKFFGEMMKDRQTKAQHHAELIWLRCAQILRKSSSYCRPLPLKFPTPAGYVLLEHMEYVNASRIPLHRDRLSLM